LGTLLIHIPAIGQSPPLSIDVPAGEIATVGRGVPECPVTIALADPAVPRLAGEILATDTYWQLSNLSHQLSLLVENPEGAGEYFRIAPRRLSAPVPFEFSRVVLATRSGTVGFQVYAPNHSYLDPRVPATRSGAATVCPFSLNEESLYFLVLVALCEPRLRDAGLAVPTTPQVVARLRRNPHYQRLTPSAVCFHIDYLADTKLRIKSPDQHSRLDWKRETLVSVALRFGLVREEHLALLPSTAPSARPTVGLAT